MAVFSIASAAQAVPPTYPEPNDNFTPKVDSIGTSTTRAGAHPDLSIKVSKRPWELEVVGFYYDWAYTEQDLKRLTISLPAGVVADANAAPYCDLQHEPLRQDPWPKNQYFYYCKNSKALIGRVDTTLVACNPMGTWGVACIGGGYDLNWPGHIYNERPRAGEQGHLVILWPSNDPVQKKIEGRPAGASYPAPTKTDASVVLRQPDLGITTVADNIADGLVQVGWNDGDPPGTLTDASVGGQIYKITMTMFGSTGAESGHPLLTNPTFCDPQTVGVEFQGYKRNSVEPPSEWTGSPTDHGPFYLGSGEGQVVVAPPVAPDPVTECDSISYDPKIAINLDATGSDQAPAISSTLIQDREQATTGEVEVRFPKRFKINDKNTATHCSPEALKVEEEATEDLPNEGCPQSSKIGEATAESPLLPIAPGGEQQKLHGNVYLAGLTSDSIKFSTFLHGKHDPDKGFIDFSWRMDAEGSIGSDLVPKTVIKNLPAVPVSKFDLNLDGGPKGLIRTPRVCGPEEITADFKSHSGKVKTSRIPVDIKGCTDPTLDVELSNRRKGEPTDLDLSVSSPGTAIKAVELRMARQLHWGQRKRLSSRVAKRIKRLKSAGTVIFNTASGERKVRFKAKRTRRGNLSFAPLTRKNREGQVVAAQVPGFTASLFRTARRQPRILTQKRRKGQKGRKARRRQQSDLVLKGLPGEDLTAVELSLRGKDRRRKFYLQNPTGCKRPLNFVAIVTTQDGRKLALKDQVRLRGKGCSKKKRK